MQVRHLLPSAALAFAFCVPGAFAADGCRTVANGVQRCDVVTGHERARADVVAEIQAPADTASGCRTVANGVQRCDVPTGRERSRQEVVAELHAAPASSNDGCRTVANGVQKCDLPTRYQRDDTALAKANIRAVPTR